MGHNLLYWFFLIPFFTPMSYSTGFVVYSIILLTRFAANTYINLRDFTPAQYYAYPFRIPSVSQERLTTSQWERWLLTAIQDPSINEVGWSGEIISIGLSSDIFRQSNRLAYVQMALQSDCEDVVQCWLNIAVCPTLGCREIISYDHRSFCSLTILFFDHNEAFGCGFMGASEQAGVM